MKVEWKGESWIRKMTPSINAGLTAAAAVMDNKAVENFGRDGSPSIPGGVPGIDLGDLWRSTRHASPEVMGTPLKAAFGTAKIYGRYLDLGTKNMAARPWIFRAALESKAVARRQFIKAAMKHAKAEGLIT